MIKQLQVAGDPLVSTIQQQRQPKGDSTSEQSPSSREPVVALFRDPLEVMFFRSLHSELQKSIRFYGRIQDEYSSRVQSLQEMAAKMKERHSISSSSSSNNNNNNTFHDRWLVLARSAFEVYRVLLLLETYAIMTYCAFSKILKKHDKMTGRSTRTAFMTSMVSPANLSNTQRLQEMIRSSLECYNEASEHLEEAGRTNLQEDERLFLNMISHLNTDVRIVADEEDAPMVSRHHHHCGGGGLCGGSRKDNNNNSNVNAKELSSMPPPILKFGVNNRQRRQMTDMQDNNTTIRARKRVRFSC